MEDNKQKNTTETDEIDREIRRISKAIRKRKQKIETIREFL